MQALPSNESSQSEDIETVQQPQLANKVLIKRCSKCGIFSKLHQSFPLSRFDAWCDECFVNTPATERTQKCSVGELWKLIQKQEAEAKERAEIAAQAEVLKKTLAEERAKNKKNAPAKSRKKTVEEPYSLPGLFEDLNATDTEEKKAREAILAHDARRAYIARARDKTIFDEDYYGERDDD